MCCTMAPANRSPHTHVSRSSMPVGLSSCRRQRHSCCRRLLSFSTTATAHEVTSYATISVRHRRKFRTHYSSRIRHNGGGRLAGLDCCGELWAIPVADCLCNRGCFWRRFKFTKKKTFLDVLVHRPRSTQLQLDSGEPSYVARRAPYNYDAGGD